MSCIGSLKSMCGWRICMVVVALVSPLWAHGAIISFGESFQLSVAESRRFNAPSPQLDSELTQQFFFDGFDHSIGQLTAIEFAINSSWSGDSRLRGQDNGRSSAFTSVSGRNDGSVRVIRRNGQAGSTIVNDGFSDPDLSCSAGGNFFDTEAVCGAGGSRGGEANFSERLAVGPNDSFYDFFLEFAARDVVVDLRALISSDILSCRGDHCESNAFINWVGEVSLSYVFTPTEEPITVPEGGTLPLFAAVLSFLFGLRVWKWLRNYGVRAR